jgi:hypothetical protein
MNASATRNEANFSIKLIADFVGSATQRMGEFSRPEWEPREEMDAVLPADIGIEFRCFDPAAASYVRGLHLRISGRAGTRALTTWGGSAASPVVRKSPMPGYPG